MTRIVLDLSFNQAYRDLMSDNQISLRFSHDLLSIMVKSYLLVE